MLGFGYRSFFFQFCFVSLDRCFFLLKFIFFIFEIRDRFDLDQGWLEVQYVLCKLIDWQSLFGELYRELLCRILLLMFVLGLELEYCVELSVYYFWVEFFIFIFRIRIFEVGVQGFIFLVRYLGDFVVSSLVLFIDWSLGITRIDVF